MEKGGFRSDRHISAFIDKKRFTKRPRYTVVLHPVRQKFELSLNTYAVIDSVHKLSSSNPNYQWCTMSKEDLAEFLVVSRSTVFRSIDEALKKGLIEKNPDGFLRATTAWIDAVEIFDIRNRRAA